MSAGDRLLARLGVGAAGLALVSLALAMWLSELNPPTGQSTAGGSAIGFAMVVYMAVGGFLVYRRPRHLVGWLILSVGFFGGTNVLATEYARYGLLTAPGSLPWASFWAWYGAWSFQPVTAAPAFLLILYPDGRPPSRRWRPLAWLLAAALLVTVAAYALEPQLELGQRSWNIRYPNPVGIAGSEHLMGSLNAVGSIAGLAGFLAALACVFARYRRGGTTERLQLKWFAYSAVAAIAVIFALESVPCWATSPSASGSRFSR